MTLTREHHFFDVDSHGIQVFVRDRSWTSLINFALEDCDGDLVDSICVDWYTSVIALREILDPFLESVSHIVLSPVHLCLDSITISLILTPHIVVKSLLATIFLDSLDVAVFVWPIECHNAIHIETLIVNLGVFVESFAGWSKEARCHSQILVSVVDME